MNSARTLADRFRTQRTDRIRVDGIEVLSLVEIDVDPNEVVEILVETSRVDLDQALNVRSSRGDLVALENRNQPGDDFDTDEGLGFELVTVLASQVNRCELAGLSSTTQTLQFWNSWLMGEAQHSWTGNSGIVAEEMDVPTGASARVRLWCSDGLGDPQFDDLVVVVTVGPMPDSEEDTPLIAGTPEEE
ncbi:MAG: hypothetical protein R8J94_00135 [Acidimicrobiia bacterium]|nr:hypothetical protein [Acidimicrobiia bacterium]